MKKTNRAALLCRAGAVGAIAGVFALTLPIARADAYSYQDVFSGSVQGVDTFGFFGTAGENLDTSYKAVYTISTTAGSGVQYFGSGDYGIFGGSQVGESDPVTGVLTINGRSFTVGASGYEGQAFIQSNPGASGGTDQGYIGDRVQDTVAGVYTELKNEVYSTQTSAGFPTYFNRPYSLQVDGSVVQADGYFDFGNAAGSELLVLSPLAASDPEPSTWALMLGGVGAMGLMFRRRRWAALAA